MRARPTLAPHPQDLVASRGKEATVSECKGLKVGTSWACLRNGKKPVWLGQARGNVEEDAFGE